MSSGRPAGRRSDGETGLKCPYSDCTKNNLKKGVERCPQCSRLLKPCPGCGEPNRAFANFCRACGRELGGAELGWTGFKGGPERRGLNPSEGGGPVRRIEEVTSLHLEDWCRSLLFSDGHLFVVTRGGRVEVVDVESRQVKGGWKVEGPITCEPCVHRGSLYLGGRQRVSAFTLGQLVPGRPLEPRWEAVIEGTLIQAFLGVEDRLYLSVGHKGARSSEIQILDGIGSHRRPAAQSVFAGPCLSTPVSSVESRRVVFFSQEDEHLTIHRADHRSSPRPTIARRQVAGAPRALRHYLPIAAVRDKVYAVFGEDSRLCSIDTERCVFGVVIKPDVQNFALSGPSDGVLIRSGSMFFLYRNHEEPLTPDDRINGAPVIIQGRAVFVGMKDGRVRWYDLSNPSILGEEHLSDSYEEVTALASYRDYVAAGGSGGTVRLYRLLEKS